MEDDFNTADAITAIFELVRFANTYVCEKSSKEFAKAILEKIYNLSDILGILFETESTNEIDTKKIEELIEKRQNARKNKDYKLADEIRNELKDMGILLEDTSAGVRWSKI